MATAMRLTGLHAEKMEKACEIAGVVCPAGKNMLLNSRKVNQIIRILSGRDFKSNHWKLVAVMQSDPEYEGDLLWKDRNGVRHSTCRVTLCLDGSGDKRAYNHHITGTQHGTVLCNRLIKNALAYHHHQTVASIVLVLLLDSSLQERDQSASSFVM